MVKKVSFDENKNITLQIEEFQNVTENKENQIDQLDTYNIFSKLKKTTVNNSKNIDSQSQDEIIKRMDIIDSKLNNLVSIVQTLTTNLQLFIDSANNST